MKKVNKWAVWNKRAARNLVGKSISRLTVIMACNVDFQKIIGKGQRPSIGDPGSHFDACFLGVIIIL